MLTNLLLKVVKIIGKQKGRLDWDADPIFLSLTTQSDLQRLTSCKKEPETVSWLRDYIKPGTVFYDVGANVGAYSLIAAQLMKGSGTVYSFEPGFANFKTLSENILLNRLSERIIPIQTAVSDTPGFINMSFSTIESGAAKHTLSFDKTLSDIQIKVPTLRLDDYVQHHHLPFPSVMKIDVDGGEWGVVEGARKTLAAPSLKTLLIEIDTSDPKSKDTVALIERVGLSLKEKFPREKGKSDHIFNFIFCRN